MIGTAPTDATMTFEALSIVIYALLIFGAIAVQSVHAAITAGLTYGFSIREGAQPGIGPAGIRIDKALGNLKEGGDHVSAAGPSGGQSRYLQRLDVFRGSSHHHFAPALRSYFRIGHKNHPDYRLDPKLCRSSTHVRWYHVGSCAVTVSFVWPLQWLLKGRREE